jgi:hypothetical protein
MADLSEDIYRSAVRPSILRFLNDFVPQGTKVLLESGKGVAYIELGECTQDGRIPKWVNGMKQITDNVKQDDKQHAITIWNIVSEDSIW